MFIAIPFEGRVRTLIRSSFVLAKRLSETTYNLSGDAFQMTQVTAEQALVFPDEAALEEGTALTDELLMQALPLESFISGISGVERVELLPYHTLGVHKYRELGIPYSLNGVPPAEEECLREWNMRLNEAAARHERRSQ